MDTYAIKFTQLNQNPTYISGAQTGIIKFNEINGSAVVQIFNTVAPHIKWELENIGEGISTGKKTISIKGYVAKTRIDIGEKPIKEIVAKSEVDPTQRTIIVVP